MPDSPDADAAVSRPIQPRRAPWPGVLAGLVAVAVALGTAELVAALVAAASAPLVAVGGVVIDHVPGPVKEFATRTFGTHDKTALLTGTTVLLAIFGGVIGWLASRRRWYGWGGIALFGVVGAAASLTRAGARWTFVLPSLVGAVAAWATLEYLSRTSDWVGTPSLDDSSPPRDAAGARRRFLVGSGVLAAVAALAGVTGRRLGTRRSVSAARNAVSLPMPAEPAGPVPAPADPRVPGLASYVTGNSDFYRIDTALSVPEVSPETWQLRIHGSVRNPMTLTYEQLMSRPMIERYITLTCVSNDVGGSLIGNARWLGVRLADLLEEAQPLPGADQVVGRSVDGFTAGAPTQVLLDGRDAMLAIGMNGEPLPIAHGFPVRMVVPGLYGYVSATKWLAELELTTFSAYSAYWVPRGWAARAPIKTESRIDTPRDGASVRRSPVVVAGVAWAQHRGISAVEVRVDQGPWQPATLAGTVSVDTWRLWSWQWTPTPGTHTLTVRATDNAGEQQTATQSPAAPDGATGWHTITVTVA